MSRPPLSYITAYLQFSVAIIFLLGYFALLGGIFFGNAAIPPDLLELAKTLAVGLSGALGLLFAFLYLRSRTDGPPDPATTSINQTTVTKTTPTEPSNANVPRETIPPNVPVAGHDPGMPDPGSPVS